jgi:hypothetical protein
MQKTPATQSYHAFPLPGEFTGFLAKFVHGKEARRKDPQLANYRTLVTAADWTFVSF